MNHFSESSFSDRSANEYNRWVSDLKPRTCLLMHWLSNLGAVSDPGDGAHRKAHQFAEKRLLLGRLVDGTNPPVSEKTNWLLDNGEFDLYVTWLMWLRFQEYVPSRFVLPEGREKVLSWVRQQLKRPELTDNETLGELNWQIERLRSSWGDNEDDPKHLM